MHLYESIRFLPILVYKLLYLSESNKQPTDNEQSITFTELTYIKNEMHLKNEMVKLKKKHIHLTYKRIRAYMRSVTALN